MDFVRLRLARAQKLEAPEGKDATIPMLPPQKRREGNQTITLPDGADPQGASAEPGEHVPPRKDPDRRQRRRSEDEASDKKRNSSASVTISRRSSDNRIPLESDHSHRVSRRRPVSREFVSATQ